MIDMRHIVTVDPSLSSSGWALFALKGGQLLGVGKIRSISSRFSLAARLRDLQVKIKALLSELKLSANDVLICESPTTMRDPKAAIKVEQVRTIFETIARERGVLVPGRINPRTVQEEVMGLSGCQKSRAVVKETALRIVNAVYSAPLKALGFDSSLAHLKKHQDIVDALLLGSLAISKIHSSHGRTFNGDTPGCEELFGRESSRAHGSRSLRFSKRDLEKIS